MDDDTMVTASGAGLPDARQGADPDETFSGEPSGAPSSNRPFAVLLRVQDLDTSIVQLKHRKTVLAERVELNRAEARLAELDAMRADVDVRRQALVDRENAIEEQLSALEQRSKGLEARLYDTGSASRDLQAIDEGVHHIAKRRAELEEQELELLVEQEPIDAELAEIEKEQAELGESASGLRAAVAAAEVVVQGELDAVLALRQLEAPKLPTDLADRYEKLRSHLKGTGAARLIGNHCDGCHLELPSVEVERIRRLPPDTVVTCDQCGRILVRADLA